MSVDQSLAVPLHSRLTYRAGVPHAYYGWLRRVAPIAHHDHPRWPQGYWTVARYADVVSVSRRVEAFRSAPHPFFEENLDFAEPLEFGGIMCLDGADHRALRTPIAPSFRPGVVRELTDTVRDIVGGLLDRAERSGEQDVVAAWGRPLPLAVILTLLAVPARQWSSVAVLMERAFGVGTETGRDRLEATRLLLAWAMRLLTADPDGAGDGSHVRAALTGLAGTDPRGAAGQLLALLNAATGTTRNLIGSCLVELLSRRGAWQSLRAGRVPLAGAVEELTRLATPLIQLTRSTVQDVTIAGVNIPAGERVVLLFASANRDESVFADPDEFVPDRPDPGHLAFGGGGPHTCLGAPLARLELTVLLEELLGRFDRPRLKVPRAHLEGLASSTLAGYRSVPVAWRPLER